MVDPILYRPHERQESQKLLTAMLDGRDFFPAVQSLSDDFHPRFFHELDWQELRPDRDYSHGPGVFQVIDDYAFAATLPSNALVRMRPGSDARSRFGKWLESYQAFFGEWVALWPAPDAYMARTPELIEHAVEALSCVGSCRSADPGGRAGRRRTRTHGSQQSGARPVCSTHVVGQRVVRLPGPPGHQAAGEEVPARRPTAGRRSACAVDDDGRGGPER